MFNVETPMDQLEWIILVLTQKKNVKSMLNARLGLFWDPEF